GASTLAGEEHLPVAATRGPPLFVALRFVQFSRNKQLLLVFESFFDFLTEESGFSKFTLKCFINISFFCDGCQAFHSNSREYHHKNHKTFHNKHFSL
ncbi:hypothetical protein, partial [Geobacillus stearothermophilus]|uniref:hypothetical protein n=1 Tax=Geobacillus stearothermophilus TaxID=1422 RepID=UPI003D1F8E61